MNNINVLRGKKVLVIDDEKFSRSIISRFFIELGDPKVLQAENGADGLALLMQFGAEIGLVICDFNMPAVNGLQFLKAVRTQFNGIAHDLPVIMLTGHSDGVLVGGAMALDVDAFIVKPVSKNNLLTRVLHVLTTPRTVKSPAKCAEVDIDAIMKRMGKGLEDAVKAAEEAEEKERAAEKEAADKPPPEGSLVAIEAVALPAILTQDLCAANGVLLLSAGTTLNQRLIDRLKELSVLGIQSIWVKHPA